VKYDRPASSVDLIKYLERATLLLAAAGTGVYWIVAYIFADADVPTWLVTRWDLLVCAPALIGGLFAFRRHGGFARTPAVIALVALAVAGIAWTDPTEQGRAALLASVILITLPLGALISKHNYIDPFLRSFSIATAGSLIYAFISTGSTQIGRLADATGTYLTNPNRVGLQAALAALFLSMTFPRRKGLGTLVFVLVEGILVVSCVVTASREAFLALVGALLIPKLFLGRGTLAAILLRGGAIVVCAISLNVLADQQDASSPSVVRRLVEDPDQTRDTLGSRVEIWRFAAGEFVKNDTWMYGTGTGGVDKALGHMESSGSTVQGGDGIWRLSPHNTLVWWAMAFGIGGLAGCVWVGYCIAREAYTIDKNSGDWRRSALVVYMALAGMTTVINQENSWCVIGAALFAMLSPAVQWRASRWRRGPVPRARYSRNAALVPSDQKQLAVGTSHD
jgi:hypothetical protein